MSKTIFFILFIVSLFLNGLFSAHASEVLIKDSCDSLIDKHIDVVKKSDEFILSLSIKKPSEILPLDILELKDNLAFRFNSLENTVTEYLKKENACPYQVMTEVLVVFDYYHFGKTALSSAHIRRAIKGFSKHHDYGLNFLEKNYKNALSYSNLRSLQKKIKRLPEFVPEELKVNYNETPEERTTYFKLEDSFLKGTSKSFSRLAFLWGKLSDSLKWRDGRLMGNEPALALIRSDLKPLDLIFEKRTFVLSNYTIPGHWGHVAIYLGSKENLIELGLWEDESFKLFRDKVEEGYDIVEIRKTGMTFVRLSDFVNLDEIAAIRVREFPLSTGEIFKNLLLQSNKKYDFQFNAHTPQEITCTELITNSFGKISWKQTKSLGTVVMQPDDIAELTLRENKAADLVFYLKGTKDNEVEILGFQDWKNLFKSK